MEREQAKTKGWSKKPPPFGFALERAANSIPNFPAAVNIVIKTSIVLQVCRAFKQELSKYDP